MNELIKTGECYYIDENGKLCLAISYCNKNDTVTTVVVIINESDAI